MKFKKVVLWAAVAIPLVAIFGAWLFKEVSIDKCLDGGGAWDYQKSICNKEEQKN